MAAPKKLLPPKRVTGKPAPKPKAEPKKKTKRPGIVIAGPPEDAALISPDDDEPRSNYYNPPTEIPESDDDMSKNIWSDAPRGSAPNMFDPHALKIRGIDTDEPKDAVLVDITSRHGKAMIEVLALNILRVGIIHPVSINKDGDSPFVTAGRRRVLAYRLIWEWVDKGDKRVEGLKEKPRVPCVTKRGGEAEQMMLMVSENEHAVADTPMSKARKANRLLALGISEADVAVAFGVTKQAVEHWKKMTDLHQDVQNAIDKGVVPASAAIELAVLPRAEQAAKLAELATAAAANGGRVTAKVTRAAARNQEGGAMPGVRDRRKVYEAVKAEELDLSEVSPELLLGWTLGEVAASRIKGLTKVLSA